MKTNFWNTIAAFAACLAISAGCDPSEESSEITFPEAQTLEIAAGAEQTVGFTADADWRLISSSTWCKFNDNGVITQTISGKAGEASVTIAVSGDAQDFDSSEADIEMTMGGKSQVVFTVTRPGIERTVTMYLDNGKEVPEEITSVELSYGNYGLNFTEIGFTANFRWKVKEMSEGLTLSEDLTGEANEDISGDDFKTAILGLETKAQAYAFNDKKIVISDVEGKYEFPFTVTYAGMRDDVIEITGITGMNRGVSYTSDGFIYSRDLDPVPTEETEFHFNVIAKDMKYKSCIVELDENDCPQISESSWIELKDDSEGNLSISVDKNTGNDRKAYLMCFPMSQDIDNIDWNLHFQDGWFTSSFGFPVTQEGVRATAGFMVSWGLTNEDVSDKLVPFSDYPIFDGSPENNGYYGAPKNNTYVYEFTFDQIKGGLIVLPLGFPDDQFPMLTSKIVDNSGITTGKISIEHANVGDMMAPKNGISVNNLSGLPSDSELQFAIYTYGSEEDLKAAEMNPMLEAYSALVLVIKPSASN